MLASILLFWSTGAVFGVLIFGFIILFGGVYMPILGIYLMIKDAKAEKELDHKMKEREKESEELMKSFRGEP